jgi:hypothetical protein
MHVRSTVGSLLGLLALLVTPWSLPLQVASTQAQSSSLFAFPVIIPDLSTDIFSPSAISVALGDYNADGLLDTAVANVGGRTQICLNNGALNNPGSSVGQPNRLCSNDGSPNVPPINLGGANSEARVLLNGDFNNDGALELVQANFGQQSLIYPSFGDGFFKSPEPLTENAYDTQSMAVGDLNDDGALDVVLANYNQPSLLLFNNGDGSFQQPDELPGSGLLTMAVAVADFSNDGLLDLVLGNAGAPSQFYVGNGDGSFAGPVNIPNTGRDLRQVIAGDLNNDGWFDLLLINPFDPSQVLLNNKTGNFVAPVDLPGSGQLSSGGTLADFNGDGWLDIVLANYGIGTPSQLYLNNGSGTFPRAENLPGTGTIGRPAAAGDLTGDGRVDLVIGNDTLPNLVFVNVGGSLYGQPEELISKAVNDNQGPSVMGDLDNDGDLDLINFNNITLLSETIIDRASRLFLNNGDGTFAPATELNLGFRIWRAVLGDMDADNDLDIVMAINDTVPANGQVVFNEGGGSFSEPVPIADSDLTSSLALDLGDMDGDGDLDVILADTAGTSRVYFNDGAGNFPENTRLVGACCTSLAVQTGDLDGDGDLDIVLGNQVSNSQVFFNLGAGDFSGPTSLRGSLSTAGMALADYNGDGWLDILLTNYGQASQIYYNRGAGVFDTFTLLPGSGNYSTTVVATDVNGDGNIDIVYAASTGQSAQIYLNDGQGSFFSPFVLAGSAAQGEGAGIVAGDIDRDGAIDLVISPGSVLAYNNLMLSTSQLGTAPPRISLPRPDPLPDGPLFSTPYLFTNQVVEIPFKLSDPQGEAVRTLRAEYSLDGGGSWRPALAADGSFGDLEADPDGTQHYFRWDTFASGFFGQSDNVVVRLIAQPDVRPIRNGIPGPTLYASVSATTYPFRVRGSQVQVLRNDQPVSGAQVYRLTGDDTRGAEPLGGSEQPFTTDVRGYLSGRGELAQNDRLVALYPIDSKFVSDGTLIFDGRTYVDLGQPAGLEILGPITMEAWVTPDDLNSIQNIIARGYASEPPPYSEVFFRIAGGKYQVGSTLAAVGGYAEAPIPAGDLGRRVHIAGVFDGTTWRLYRNGEQIGSGASQYGATQFNGNWAIGGRVADGDNRIFKGRLGEVRIWNIARSEQQIKADLNTLLVGNEPGLAGYWPLRDGSGNTAQNLASGAQDGVIVGAAAWGGSTLYTRYLTSAAPNANGLALQTVSGPGIQTLVVSENNDLILFNLDIALEWDARADVQFMARLRSDLQRASELLYSWSNGQIALGELRIFHDREGWNDAHIRVYATNRLRPNADQGGITADLVSDPGVPATIYAPGQVRMGAVWNRFGLTGGNLGEDWPRALAHELGHFLLFLQDNYIGLDDQGRLISVESCPGPMSDPYRDDYNEFHPDAGWLPACANTMSNRTSGRSDWATIKAFYDSVNPNYALDAPASLDPNRGPSALPLQVTTISEVAPAVTDTTLPVNIYSLTLNNGRAVAGAGAQAFLFPGSGDRIIELGSPVLDQVTARGARQGDRLCVYDPAFERLGCKEPLTPTNQQLELASKPGWRPDLQVTPATSRTINLAVGNLPSGLDVRARLYPAGQAALAPIVLTLSGVVYSGTFALEQPVINGHILVWVEGDQAPRRETVASFALGGSPTPQRGLNTPQRGLNVPQRGLNTPQRGLNAPALSSDGQVIIFSDEQDFPAGEFYTVQTAGWVPPAPPGRTQVGQGYWLRASAGAPSLNAASINIGYQERNVPAGEEASLQLYRWDGVAWSLINSTPDLDENEVVARLRGPGLYTLMAGVGLSLSGPGWNLISYPVQGEQPVAEALASIEGAYSTVYGYAASDSANPWRIYDDTLAPEWQWINDLETLSFGNVYWLRATEAITLYLSSGASTPATRNQLTSFADGPPATYYGRVVATANFTPTVGMSVEAFINGVSCARSTVRQVDNQLVYVLKVRAAGSGSGNCGAAGRNVEFRINGQSIEAITGWFADGAVRYDLGAPTPGPRLLIPMIRKP